MRKSHLACSIPAALLLASLPAAAADSTGLSYEVRFTEEEMTLDGHGHESSWALAPVIELTDRHYPGLMAIDSVSTRVKALWNDKGLLVLFQMGGFADMPYRQMLTAYEHHMKQDLSGYPANQRPRKPTLFSRIVAVADGFDAGTSTIGVGMDWILVVVLAAVAVFGPALWAWYGP